MLVVPFRNVAFPCVKPLTEYCVDRSQTGRHRCHAWRRLNDLHLHLALGHTEVFVQFDGLAVNLAVNCPGYV